MGPFPCLPLERQARVLRVEELKQFLVVRSFPVEHVPGAIPRALDAICIFPGVPLHGGAALELRIHPPGFLPTPPANVSRAFAGLSIVLHFLHFLQTGLHPDLRIFAWPWSMLSLP